MTDYGYLLSLVPVGQEAAYRAYVAELFEHFDEVFMVDEQSPGFIEDYVNFAALLKRKANIHGIEDKLYHRRTPPLTVYDVGCATALQHLVFDPRIHYVGIDVLGAVEPKFFRPNCRFVQGRFAEVVKDLNIDRHNSIGIANMSLLYYIGPGHVPELEVFDRTFRQKMVL